MTRSQVIGAVVVWGVAALIATPLFLYATPILEARLAPVLSDQRTEVGPGDRTPGRVCWTWWWHKNRFAEPISLTWAIVVEGTAVELPVVIERERDNRPLGIPKVGTLGPGSSDFCVSIPEYLDRIDGLTLRGQMNYRMPHGLWTIWQPLAQVKVPPLPRP